MPLRYKLLILLILFAAGPLLLARWSNRLGFNRMGEDLQLQTRTILLDRACEAIGQQILDHARHIRLREELLELAVEMQSEGLAWHRAEAGSSQHGVHDQATMPRRLAPGFHRRMPVPPDASLAERMRPIFEAVAQRFGQGVLWQVCLLEKERAAWPPLAALSPDAAQADLEALLAGAPDSATPAWSAPFQDPGSGRLAMLVSQGNRREGLALCAVDAAVLLSGGGHLDRFSPRAQSFLVRAEPGESLRLAAWRGGSGPDGQAAWLPPRDAGADQAAMHVMTAASNASVARDVLAGRPGVFTARADGLDLHWSHAPLGRDNLALLVIMPEDDLTDAAAFMQGLLAQRLDEQRAVSGATFLGVLIFAVACSVIVSRRMHQRVSKLLQGFRQVADGDFAARIHCPSRDEFGQLSRSFNAMVPALEERFRIMEALDLARAMQQRLLPQAPPVFPGLELAGTCRYCEATGGDFHDFLTPAAGAVDVVVGDVSGHGLSAALLMATARASLRQRAAVRSVCCGEVRLHCNVTDVNRQLSRDLDFTGAFVTLAYLRVFPRKGRLAWIRAGHDPALLYDPEADAFLELAGGAGIPLGVDQDWRYDEASHDLAPGQVVVVGTDGIWETMNQQGEQFGKARFRDSIRRAIQRGESLSDLIETVCQDVAAFRGAVPQADDLTLAALRITLPLSPQPDPEPAEPPCPRQGADA